MLSHGGSSGSQALPRNVEREGKLLNKKEADELIAIVDDIELRLAQIDTQAKLRNAFHREPAKVPPTGVRNPILYWEPKFR